MRQITGFGGELFLTSEPARFVNTTLEDCGDGFDWRARDPSLRLWCQEGVFTFQVYEHNQWHEILPLELFHQTGRVSFGRCLRNLAVRGSGNYRPLTHIGSSFNWEVKTPLTVNSMSVLGDNYEVSQGRPQDSSAALYGCILTEMYRPFLEESEALALLPFASGALVGVGAVADKEQVRIDFNEEGVRYARV